MSFFEGVLFFLTLVFLIVMYFLPTVVAFIRSMPQRASVLVINMLLGWTVIGWVVALAMAVSGGSRRW